MKLLPMRRVSSVFFVLALLFAASFTLTSCGGDDDNGGSVYTLDQYEKGILGQWNYDEKHSGGAESLNGKVSYYDNHTKISISFNGSTGSFSSYSKDTYTGGVKKGTEATYESACDFKYEWITETDHWGEKYKTVKVTVTKVTKGEDFLEVGDVIYLTVSDMTSNKLRFKSNRLVSTYTLTR